MAGEDIARRCTPNLKVTFMAFTTSTKIDTLPSGDRDTDPELSAARTHAKEQLRQAFATLPERERKVAVLLYVYELTLREIGEILGVTESRVCQIHAQILHKLRARLDDHQHLFLAATAA